MEVFTKKKPNDQMFEGNLSLRAWVNNSILNSIALAIDDSLVDENEKNFSEKLDCVSSIMEVALNCTRESPKDRHTMEDVIVALEKIKLQMQEYQSS